MDTIVSELGGSWSRFLISIPLDVLILLFLLYLSRALIFYFVGRRKKINSIIPAIASAVFFAWYYLSLREILLDYPWATFICIISLSLCLLLMPAILASNPSRAFRLLKLITVGILRRVLEYSLALIVFVSTFPLFIIISVLVKLSTHATIFERHSGLSRAGKPITLYSFRTKIPYWYKYSHQGFFMTSEKSPRFTRFGRALHKSSLHLLPRLFNVLNGDLYLFGVTPFNRDLMVHSFSKELLEKERTLVTNLYDVPENKAFNKILDYSIPVGVVTYADLNAYQVKFWRPKIIKSLDMRPLLLEEAHYFLFARLPSLRLFIILIGKFIVRFLSAFNLVKMEEVRLVRMEEVRR